jgi:hypothetical protein
MGHIPDDDNFEEYMSASADEWSKPEKSPPKPELKNERVDKWGSPIPEEASISDTNRWGSEPIETGHPNDDFQAKKSGAKWLIIAAVVAVVLCLCACLVLAGLEVFQVTNLF